MTREVGHLLAFANSGERKDAHSRGPSNEKALPTARLPSHHDLAEIESASWCALLGGFCRSSAMRGEVGYRLGRLLYRVVAFCVLALSITGAASAPGIHLALSRRWREGRVASAQVATSPTSTAERSCTS